MGITHVMSITLSERERERESECTSECNNEEARKLSLTQKNLSAVCDARSIGSSGGVGVRHMK